jgi:hypothetical protein
MRSKLIVVLISFMFCGFAYGKLSSESVGRGSYSGDVEVNTPLKVINNIIELYADDLNDLLNGYWKGEDINIMSLVPQGHIPYRNGNKWDKGPNEPNVITDDGDANTVKHYTDPNWTDPCVMGHKIVVANGDGNMSPAGPNEISLAGGATANDVNVRTNVLYISPATDLNVAYQALGSSTYTASMGTLSKTNRRVLDGGGGYYTEPNGLQLIQYVDLRNLVLYVPDTAYYSTVIMPPALDANEADDAVTNYLTNCSFIGKYIGEGSSAPWNTLNRQWKRLMVLRNCFIYGTADLVVETSPNSSYDRNILWRLYNCEGFAEYDGITMNGRYSTAEIYGGHYRANVPISPTQVRCYMLYSGNSTASNAIGASIWANGAKFDIISDMSQDLNDTSGAEAIGIYANHSTTITAINCDFNTVAVGKNGGTPVNAETVHLSYSDATVNLINCYISSNNTLDVNNKGGGALTIVNTNYDPNKVNGAITVLPANGEQRVVRVLDVNMKAGAAATTLYTVPTNRDFWPTKVIIRNPSASLAGGVDYDFTNWRQTVDLSSMTTAGLDCMTINPVDVTKYQKLVAGQAFQITPSTGSTATATCTIDVYGYLK